MNAQVSGGDSSQGRRPPAEPEIEIIEEGTQAATKADEGQKPAASGQGYDYPDEDEGQMGGSDARVGHEAGSGDTGQADGQPSKEELTARQKRRARERDARNRERAELLTLRRQVANLQSRFEAQDSRIQNSEAASLESQITAIEADIHKAGTVMSRAMAAQNTEDFGRALNIRDALRDQLSGLRAQKAQFDSESGGGDKQKGPAQSESRQQLGAAQLHYAAIFTKRHPWYKHGSQDQDSQSVVQIDNEMMAQGLNPQIPEYWVELERRVREDIPHRFEEAANQGVEKPTTAQKGNGQSDSGNPRRAGGPKLPGSGNAGGSSDAGGGPIKFHLSRERKDALINLGVWDDPEKRTKHIRRFMEWDKANAAAKKE